MLFLEPLNRSGIEYMVTGSVAGMIYGEPRLTHDIDLVLGLYVKDVSQFKELFPDEKFYCPSEDTIKTEINRESNGHFNVIHHQSGFKAYIYPAGEDKLHKWAMARRNKVDYENADVWLAPAEYVIVRKLEYYKQGGGSKHLRDIKRMLEVSPEAIDLTILQKLIAEQDLSTQWDKLQNINE